MAKLAHDLERSCAAAPAELDGLERVFEDTRDALRSALLEDDVTFLLLSLAVVAFAIAVLARRAAPAGVAVGGPLPRARVAVAGHRHRPARP